MLKGSARSPLGALRRMDEPKILPRALPPRRASTVAHKELASIDAAFDAFGITDGSTLSFHHHFRNGDRTVLAVMECAARRGLRGLTLAASSLFPVHDRLREHIASGVVQQIVTSYLKGAAADAVTDDELQGMALLQSHGGRARAIAAGELRIDAAFIAAPCAERNGAATGRAGALACGPLGYAMVDAAYARHTAVLAHEIRDTPLPFVDIPADQVDAVVPLDRPGTTEGIRSGATVPASTAAARKIGHLAVEAIRAAGLLHDGLSLQSGAGGYSLAAVPVLAQGLRAKGAKGGFVSGGITGAHVKIVAHGLAREIRDVQCFDQDAILSSMTDPWHKAMSAAAYASPIHSGPVVDDLGVREWVASMPAGLDTGVGERGDQLSAGERQLVALLRAGLADPDVLILDEATSSVDALTEVRIARALDHLATGRTTIAIAHRLSTAARADRVLVLEQGLLVEDGPHNQLIANPAGQYRRLYEIQAGGFLMAGE